MSYINLNNPANFQLQEFEQLGFRYIVSGRPSIGGETYRTLFVLEAAVVTTTSPEGDSLSSETLAAGTLIHGFFSDVSVTSGALLAYKAGPITAQEIYDFYRAYVEANGGVIEGESCAVTEIAALLAEGLYSMASLVLIPSGYKTGVVYSERPTTADGQLTFTRNSNATRVNSEGLVEKVRTNLLTYSNGFNAWPNWVTSGLSATHNEAGYDGTNDAWKIFRPLLNTGNSYIYQNSSATGYVTFSVYAKADTKNWVSLTDAGTGGTSCYFDLANGTTGTGTGEIESLGNGWYRLQIVSNRSSSGNFIIRISNSDGGLTVGPNGSIYIQNAQLEVGDIATDYIPTTTSARSTFAGVTVNGTSAPNVPRLDYSGGATCPSLLLEPQRTNLYLYSEQLSQWTATAGSTVIANYGVSPDGYQNADRVQFTAGSLVYISGTGSAGENTLSVYAKATNGTSAKFRFFANGATAFSSDQTATGEWQRFTFTYTYSAVTAGLARPTTNLGVDDVLFWGFQHEIGSYATSYIPTLGASVTRLADACNKTGISSIIGQTQGTLYCEFAYSGLPIVRSGPIYLRQASLRGLSITFAPSDSPAGIRFTSRNNAGTTDLIIVSGALQIGTYYKIAISYDAGTTAAGGSQSNGIVAYVNGVQIGTATFRVPDVDIAELRLYGANAGDDTEAFNGNVKQALLFKTRLSNEQLALLTTL